MRGQVEVFFPEAAPLDDVVAWLGDHMEAWRGFSVSRRTEWLGDVDAAGRRRLAWRLVLEEVQVP